MKTFIMMRHGKTEIGAPTTNDYDRTLTDRGKKNASDMGTFIRQRFGVPDLILSSSAKRAYQTAKRTAKSITYPKENIVTDESLYLASEEWILATVSNLSDEINSCLYIGHNPGLTDLVNALHIRLDNLPTASAICFEFDVDSWKGISPKRAIFRWIKLARELSASSAFQ